MIDALCSVIGSDDYFTDPYPHLERLRKAQPVCFVDQMGGLLVTSHAAACQVLDDPTFKAGRVDDYIEDMKQTGRQGLLDGSAALMRDWFIFMDGTQHAVRKAALAPLFSKQVLQSAPYVRSKARRLVENWCAAEGGDFIRMVARPLATDVICEVLGIPQPVREPMQFSSQPLSLLVGQKPMSPTEEMQAEASVLYLISLMRGVVNEKIGAPDDSLISRFLGLAGAGGDPVARDRVVSDMILLLFGGQDTSANAMGNALCALSDNPGNWSALQASKDNLAWVVEEFLRFDPPVQSVARRVSEQTELAGVSLKPGDRVVVSLAAACRDPAVFEAPNRLAFDRPAFKQRAFGGGAHICLGAALARLELIAVLEALLEYGGLPRKRALPVYPRSLTLRGPLALDLSVIRTPVMERTL